MFGEYTYTIHLPAFGVEWLVWNNSAFLCLEEQFAVLYGDASGLFTHSTNLCVSGSLAMIWLGNWAATIICFVTRNHNHDPENVRVVVVLIFRKFDAHLVIYSIESTQHLYGQICHSYFCVCTGDIREQIVNPQGAQAYGRDMETIRSPICTTKQRLRTHIVFLDGVLLP